MKKKKNKKIENENQDTYPEDKKIKESNEEVSNEEQ